MNWNKYSIEDQVIPGLVGLAIVMIIIGLYIQSKWTLFLAGFFLAIIMFNRYYLKKVGNGLVLEDRNELNRFFIGEEGNWDIVFKNHGYPIIKGELRVSFDSYVAPKGNEQEDGFSLYEVNVPFSIFTNQTKHVEIPFTAIKRGIARIRKIEYRLPSLIGFGEMVLESRFLLKQQAVVYPSTLPVKGLMEQKTIRQGHNAVPFSVFEERLGPLGTRDYVSTDSFNRIHWKASARKQILQTKLYEKISETGCVIGLNISNGHSITGDLETYISAIAEFAYYAYQQQFPFSLCINVRTAGSTPFLYLPKGEGKEHLQKVLETLSSVSSLNTTLPYHQLVSFYQRHFARQPFFIHLGVRTEETNRLLLNEAQKGVRLMELTLAGEDCLFGELEIQKERRLPL
ncbi:DUF58 domain-containing protein [Neobacillus sp. SAB-20_R2A]|uniref:DUF58 domain-containing protein n=1 Tax=Neobacillus sp. SAB-20_R2A TaxID=3120519 RepID=UPI003C6DDCD6